MMGGIEAALGERSVVGLGLRGEGEEAPEELLLAGVVALREQCLGMIRILDVAMALIAAQVASDEGVVVVQTQPIRIDLERQQGAGLLGRHRVAIGIVADAKAG
jgi:hypothetical protein